MKKGKKVAGSVSPAGAVRAVNWPPGPAGAAGKRARPGRKPAKTGPDCIPECKLSYPEGWGRLAKRRARSAGAQACRFRPGPAGPVSPSPACQRGLDPLPAPASRQAVHARAYACARLAWHGMAGMPATRARVRPRQAGRQAGRPGQARPYLCPGRGPGPAPGGVPPPAMPVPPAGMPWSSSCPRQACPGRQGLGRPALLSLFSFRETMGQGRGRLGGHAGGVFFCGCHCGKIAGRFVSCCGFLRQIYG